jgi:hypothetical protein
MAEKLSGADIKSEIKGYKIFFGARKPSDQIAANGF